MNTITGLDEYQEAAWRTAKGRTSNAYPEAVRESVRVLREHGHHELAAQLITEHLKNVWTLGLAGESGEVADLQKKVTGHGAPYDRAKTKKELGDSLWYIAAIAKLLDMTLSEIATGNIEKLWARHPNGFSVESAAAKRDERGE